MGAGRSDGLGDRLEAGQTLAALAEFRRELGVRVADLAGVLKRQPSTVRRREHEPAPFAGELRTYRNALRAVLTRREDPLGRLGALALREDPADPRGWLLRLAESLEAAQ